MRKPTYEELRRLAAMYEPAPRKRGYRAVIMATVFLVGTSVGLGGAWWMTKGGQTTVVASGASRDAPALRSFRLDGDRTQNNGKGISAAERPFDGAKHAALPKRAPAPPITPEELPYGGQSSGSNGQVNGNVASGSGEQVTPAQAPTAEELAAITAVPPVAAARPTQAPQAMAASPDKALTEKPVNKATENVADKAAEKSANGPSLNEKPAEKRLVQAAPPAAAKDAEKPKVKRVPDSRELDRIRQQAAEELRRKNEARRLPNEARANASQQKTAKARPAPDRQPRARLVYNQLAACENAGNFLLREQCKWQLCSGRWGKNGCPSYSTSHSAAY